MLNSMSDLARKVQKDLFGRPSSRKPLLELPGKIQKDLFGEPKKNRRKK